MRSTEQIIKDATNARGEIMGLTIEVYKNSLGDCSNNGISASSNSLFVICPEGYITITDAKERGLPLMRVVVRQNLNYMHLQECNVDGLPIDDKWRMFGGNYGSTSDSRFGALSQYPLGIHDRIED